MRKLTPQRIALNRLTEHIVKAYETGTSLREIASWYGASAGTIRGFLIENGVKMRKPGRQKGK